MQLSECQKQVALSTKRFRVMVAGRRVGKTTLAIREACFYAKDPNRLIWICGPSYRQMKQIAWVMLKKKLQDLRWVKNINEAELTIILKNNSRICLRGADNKNSLRGVGIDFLILDECADIDESAWTEVLRPTLSDTKGRALFTGTPKGMNWFYDLYQRGQNPEETEYDSFQFTTAQGGFVDEEELSQAKRDLDQSTYRQEYESTFESHSGVVFYGFDMKENVKPFEVPQDNTMIYIGMDFNVSPLTAVVFFIKNSIVHVFDEIEIWGSNTDEMCQEIHSRYPGKKIMVFPDPACRQRRTSAGGKTDLSILQNAGFVCKVPNSHDRIRDGVNAVNSKLCNALGERGILFHPKVKKIVNSLTKLTYKENTSVIDKTKGLDHICDSLRYAITYLYPIKTHYNFEQPQRFVVKTGANS